MSSTRIRGFSESPGSWNTICMRPRRSRVLLRRHLRAVEANRAVVGGEQPEHEPRDRALARARLADEAERLAALDLEGDRRQPHAAAARARQRSLADVRLAQVAAPAAARRSRHTRRRGRRLGWRQAGPGSRLVREVAGGAQPRIVDVEGRALGDAALPAVAEGAAGLEPTARQHGAGGREAARDRAEAPGACLRAPAGRPPSGPACTGARPRRRRHRRARTRRARPRTSRAPRGRSPQRSRGRA